MILTIAATFLNFFGTPCADYSDYEHVVQEEVSELNFLISVLPTEDNFLSYNEGKLKALSFFAAAEDAPFSQNFQSLYSAFQQYQKEKNKDAAKGVIAAVNSLIENPLPALGSKCTNSLLNLLGELQNEVAQDYATVTIDTLWHLYGEVDMIDLFEKDLQWEFDQTLKEIYNELGELIQASSSMTWLKLRDDVNNLHDWVKVEIIKSEQ